MFYTEVLEVDKNRILLRIVQPNDVTLSVCPFPNPNVVVLFNPIVANLDITAQLFMDIT